MGRATSPASQPPSVDFGAQVAAARRSRRQSQTQLANALTAYLGERWTRHMVSNLENGDKVFTAEILRAVAKIQDFSYSWYLDGPRGNPPREAGLAQGVVIPLVRRKGAERPTLVRQSAARSAR